MPVPQLLAQAAAQDTLDNATIHHFVHFVQACDRMELYIYIMGPTPSSLSNLDYNI